MSRKLLHRTQVAVVLATLALVSTSASAVLIDFNGLANGTVVINQFAEASFSSEPGEVIVAASGFICTGSPINCQNDIYIDFTNAVSNISLTAVEPNEFGTVATFLLYSGATLLGTQDLLGLGAGPGLFGSGSISVALAGFSGVTRLEIRGPGGSGQTDQSYGGNGIGWDDLRFDLADITSVPEPGPASLMAIAMLALGITRAQRSSNRQAAA